MKINLTSRVILNLIFVLMTAMFIGPLIIAILISISNENDILTYGYSIIPKNIDLAAYKMAFGDLSSLLRGYGITMFSSTVGAALMVLLCASIGYAVSQQEFIHRRFVMVYVVITMLFSGGLIPSYIVNTQLLHLNNSLWVHLFIGLVSAWNIILFRTFFQQIPTSLIESASIDGANQLQVLINVIIPMSKSILAMVFFNTFLSRWNNYEITLYYINDKKLYSLQYFLMRIIENANFIKETYKMFNIAGQTIPIETLKFAICVLGAFPVLILFPFIQKYFSKGIAVGAVKG